MDVKKCPNCARELPVQLSFCPYCMHSSAEEIVIPVKPAPAVPFLRYGVFAALLFCAVLLFLLLLPDRTPLPAGGTPTDLVSQSSESAPVMPQTSSVQSSPAFSREDTASFSPGTVSVPAGSVTSVPLREPVTSAVSPIVIPSAPSTGSSAPSGSAESSQEASSKETETERRLRLLEERSLKEFPRYVELWNKAAKETGFEKYAIVSYDSTPGAIGGMLVNIEKDYLLFLNKVRLAGGSIIVIEWQCSAVKFEKGGGCSVSLTYPRITENDPNGIPDRDVKYINYLALATFTEYRDDNFVNEFYTEEGWEQLGNMNSGIHNGWTYRKKGTYNGFRFEDGYLVLFEEEEINQDIIAAWGTNISRNYWFRFEYWNNYAWLNAGS